MTKQANESSHVHEWEWTGGGEPRRENLHTNYQCRGCGQQCDHKCEYQEVTEGSFHCTREDCSRNYQTGHVDLSPIDGRPYTMKGSTPLA